MPVAAKQTKSKKAPEQDASKSVSWPPIVPTVPIEDLSLREVHIGQIFTVSSFWPSGLCKKYVSFLNTLPLTSTPGQPKKGEALRVNDRFQIDDATFAERLWCETGLKELVMQVSVSGPQFDEAHTLEHRREQLWGGQPVGLNPNIRVYRYRKGQFFDQHYDESNMVTHLGPPPTAARTTWTLLLYLTSAQEGCSGGETVFYPEPCLPPGAKGKKARIQPEPIVVSLETGMALLHKHGKDCLLHEGREVTNGEKWVIRSDLCVKQ